MITNKDFELYPEELEVLNKVLKEHGGNKCEGGGVEPIKYRIVFLQTSIRTIPYFECNCGHNVSLECEERMWG